VFLTGFLTRRDSGYGLKRSSFGTAAVVCLVLLALLAVVQVAHFHPQDTDADHCPLCIVMHSAVPVAMTAAVVVLVKIATGTPAALQERAIVRYWHPTLFTRPPPVGSQGV
jgi:hypothetical protein